MKKIISILSVAAVAVLGISSCNSLLEQESPSTFDESVVFSNFDLAQGSIFGIVQTLGETNCYRGRFLPWYGFNTDIEWYNGFGSSSKPIDGKNEITSYGITSNNSQLNLDNGPFNMMYSGVERANLTIKGLRDHADLSNKDMAHLLGEALTLRAMLYYDLCKAWGDVPARFSPVEASNMYVKKSSRDEIFKHILSDLDEAIDYLYYPGESAITANTDRVNKLFAQGLYARIALTAAGYALRPDDGAVGTGDMGSVRLTNDPELAKSALYPKALAHLRDAINSEKASLIGDYETLWRNFNSFDLTAGKEVLYNIPFSNGRGRWNYTFAIKSEGANINGYSVKQGGTAGPLPTVWFKYESEDTRRDITCVNYIWEKTGAISPAGIQTWYFGKYRFEWMDTNPYTGGNDDGAKPVVMRYSDILLMAAEIENELNGPTQDAQDWLLKVRSRAYKGNEAMAENYVRSLSSKEAFFQAITEERALEFCGEFLRKADLIRWNMLSSSLETAKQDLYALRDRTGKFSHLGGDIWYKLGDDEESIVIWGLDKKEQIAPEGDDWTQVAAYVKYDDSKKTGLFEGKIENLYINNPDQYMFWPIFDNTVANSQGYIVNDYAYSTK